jgi:drug/metabolite transporter (DMT)-like permease
VDNERGFLMHTEIALALAASFFTAFVSVAQRRAAAPAPGELSFSWRLVAFLIRRPVWVLGIFSMIAGFGFQVLALRNGSLSVVQPVIATELLFVFGFVALSHRHRVRAKDWLSAVGMAVGLGWFLALARPSGGIAHPSSWRWALAGLATLGLSCLVALLAYAPGPGGGVPSASRKAAMLSVAAAAMFGWVAAVVKELGGLMGQGPAAVFTSWPPYVLLVSGAFAMFLASNAFQAGTLAASQPGLTIVDPLVSSALGVVLFREVIHHDPVTLIGEGVAVAVVIASVILLSHSPLVREVHPAAPEAPPLPELADPCDGGPVQEGT